MGQPTNPARHTRSSRRNNPSGRIDLTGNRVNHLTVLGPVTDRQGRMHYPFRWRCRCDCGRVATIIGGMLRSGRAFSCGCRWRVSAADRSHRSGYRAWARIHRSPRCCARWRRTSAAFLEDMGTCPAGHRLSLRNPRGRYTPSNCSWAPRSEAVTERTRLVTLGGRTMPVAAWARELGISRQAMWQRAKRTRT